MDIMDHLLPTATPHLHMLTPLRPMGIGILITDRATIPATGTVVIMVEGAMLIAVMDIIGKENALWAGAAAIELYFAQVVAATDKAMVVLPEKGALTQDSFGVM